MKTKYSLLTFLLLSIQFGYSQSQPNIDSLLNIYKTTKIDSIKLKTNNGITSYYKYRDINKSKSYAYKQLKLAHKIDHLKEKMIAYDQLAIIYNILSEYDSARYYIENTIKIAKQTNDLIQQSSSAHSLVILEISQRNFVSAERINKQNLEFNEKVKDTFGIALSYDTESSIYSERMQNILALKSALKSLDMFKTMNNKIRIADALNKIAIIENSLENYDSSIEYSKKALKIYEEYEDVEYQATMFNILGMSYTHKKDYKNANSYFKNSLKISKPNGYVYLGFVSKLNLTAIYLENKEYDIAKKLIDESLEIAHAAENKSMIFYFNIRLAVFYKHKKNYNRALNLINSLIKDASIDRSSLLDIHKLKSDIFKLQNNYKNAFENFEIYKKLKDSIYEKTKVSRINELRIIHQTEQKEAEITLQNEEINTLGEKAKVDKLTKSLYAGGAVSGVALSGLLFFGFRQRIKKNKIAREKQDEIYKQEIAFKQKELASQTLHLVQKNTFLQELKVNLENLKSSPEKFKIEFRRIVLLLKKESSGDKDWEVFKSYFSEVHDNFDNKIKAVYKDITEKELRLASFIKMNLSTKEIATLLNVLPDSVLKSKYRLKKKLAINKETDLYQFLIDL